MTKHIVFDFDGTLVNSIGIMFEIGNELAQKYKYTQLKKEDFASLRNLSIKELCKKLGIPFYKLPKLLMETLSRYRRFLGTLQMMEGMRELILKLHEQGYILSIISSNSVPNIETFLKNNHLQDTFHNIYSSKGLFGKHNTINGFIKKYNIPKKNMIYVGDEIRDIDACKISGVKIIAVSWGFNSAALLSKAGPDYLVHTPLEIVHILNSQSI
ncbi:MAG: HAD-IA family hydrolase [Clostridia bacterium]|nr:HAD-IA family hydrolase [Clostridia bacterium]